MEYKNTDINGIHLSYLQTPKNGDPQRPSLLFVHGNSSCLSAFQLQMEDIELSKRFNLIAVDLPGHGSSPSISQAQTDESIYTIAFYAEVLDQFLQALSIDKPVAIGHSLGAHITTALSKIRPLSGLFNIQNTPIHSAADAAQALSQESKFQQLFNPEVDDSILKSLGASFFRETPPPSFFEDFKSCDPNCRKNLFQSLASGLVLDEIDYLKETSMPFQLVIGQNDSFTQMDYIRGLNLGDKVHFINSHHYPTIEDSPTINSLICQFTQDIFQN